MSSAPDDPPPQSDHYQEVHDEQIRIDGRVSQLRLELDELKMHVVGYDGQTEHCLKVLIEKLQRDAKASEVRQDASRLRQEAIKDRVTALDSRQTAFDCRQDVLDRRQNTDLTEHAVRSDRECRSEKTADRRLLVAAAGLGAILAEVGRMIIRTLGY